jgi:hypothetical protein
VPRLRQKFPRRRAAQALSVVLAEEESRKQACEREAMQKAARGGRGPALCRGVRELAAGPTLAARRHPPERVVGNLDPVAQERLYGTRALGFFPLWRVVS